MTYSIYVTINGCEEDYNSTDDLDTARRIFDRMLGAYIASYNIDPPEPGETATVTIYDCVLGVIVEEADILSYTD